jgi:uncharacterized small protein (DUF1192 family)
MSVDALKNVLLAIAGEGLAHANQKVERRDKCIAELEAEIARLRAAPAAGTVEKDAAQRVEKRIHNIWENAQIAWGDACGGPQAYEIFAHSLIAAMQDEIAAIEAHNARSPSCGP